MDLELRGRVAFVTGSWRGTGAGIARVLAAEGATVLVHAFEDGLTAEVADAIRGAGGDAREVVGDLRDDAGAERACAAALEAAGAVDILVTNYGVAKGRDWFDAPDSDWLASFDANVLTGVRVIRRLVPQMRDRGWGRVVQVSTVGAWRPAARTPHYYGSKAALLNMTVSLAKELDGSGVTVNTVSPGIIATAEVRAHFTRLAEKRGEPTDWPSVERLALREFMPNPSGRVGEPEDVGHLVAFLASDRARYVNGANLRIDGGAADCAP